MDIRR